MGCHLFKRKSMCWKRCLLPISYRSIASVTLDMDVAYRAAVHTLYPDQPILWGRWLPDVYPISADRCPPALAHHTCYIHLDLDCFYAQVEAERLGVDNDNVPFVLQQWSNLIAVNYPARAHGIKRFHSMKDAREMCPNLQSAHVPTYSVAPFLQAENAVVSPDTATSWAVKQEGSSSNGGSSATASSSPPLPQVLRMGILPQSILERGYPYQESRYYANPTRTTHKVSLDPYRAASRRIFATLRSFTSVSQRGSSSIQLPSQSSSQGGSQHLRSAQLGVSKAGVDEAFLDATEAAAIEVDNLWLQWTCQPTSAAETFEERLTLISDELASLYALGSPTLIEGVCAPIVAFLAHVEAHVANTTKRAGVTPHSSALESNLPSIRKYAELWAWVGDFRLVLSSLREFDHQHRSRAQWIQLILFFSNACLVTASLLGGSVVSHAVRAAIKMKTGYNCSCGISLNRVVAKITSATFKPNQQTLLLPQDVLTYLASTCLQSLRGFGGKLGTHIGRVVMAASPGLAGVPSVSPDAPPLDVENDDEDALLFEDEPAEQQKGGVPTAIEQSGAVKQMTKLTCGDCWHLDDCRRDFYGAFQGCEQEAIGAFLQLRGIVNHDAGEPIVLGVGEELMRAGEVKPPKMSFFVLPPLPAKSILANKVINKTCSTPTLVAWIQCLAVEVAQRLDSVAADYAELVLDLLQHYLRKEMAGRSPYDAREEYSIRVEAKLCRISFNQSGYAPATDYGSKTLHPPNRPPPRYPYRDASEHNCQATSLPFEVELAQTSAYCKNELIPFIIKAATAQLIDQCGPPARWKAAVESIKATTAHSEGQPPRGDKRQREDSGGIETLLVPTTLQGKVTTLNVALAGLNVLLVRHRTSGSGMDAPQVLSLGNGDCIVDVDRMAVVTSSGKGGRPEEGGVVLHQSTLASAFSKAPVRPTDELSDGEGVVEVSAEAVASSLGPLRRGKRSGGGSRLPSSPPSPSPKRSVIDMLGSRRVVPLSSLRVVAPKDDGTAHVLTISDDDEQDGVIEL